MSTSHREENYTQREKRPRNFFEFDSERSFNYSREDHGTAECIYEPPSGKYLKLNDDGDYVRRGEPYLNKTDPRPLSSVLRVLV